MFGIPLKALFCIVCAALVLIAAAFIGGRMIGWDSRGKLDAAVRASEIAEAGRKSAVAQATINQAQTDLAGHTFTNTNRARAAEQRGVQEIRDAARTEDFDVLNAAIVVAVNGVWHDAGAGPSGGAPELPAGTGAGLPRASDA